MKRINVLDKSIAELIAAGEVVERPSSVVKELLENSIDAGADKITVEIKNGGNSMIKITDNGSGIYKDDVKNAFLRHATSKVKSQSDLDSIMTLGFRGEALASICAVSKVEILTFCKDEEVGTRYIIEGGEEKLFEDAGRAAGTTFTVKDLFFNTPARMKFLKKDATEAGVVSDIIDKIALSRPDISIKFIKDGKEIINTPGNGKVNSCIYSVYGKDVFSKMIPIKYELSGVKIEGFVSLPENARSSRSLQNFFINSRYAKLRPASVALEEAFKGSLTVGKHPACAIYVNIPPQAVDVNVHPAKTEVRFINEKPIFEAVYYAVKSALHGNTHKKEMFFSEILKKDNNQQNDEEESRSSEIKSNFSQTQDLAKNNLSNFDLNCDKVKNNSVKNKKTTTMVSNENSVGIKSIASNEVGHNSSLTQEFPKSNLSNFNLNYNKIHNNLAENEKILAQTSNETSSELINIASNLTKNKSLSAKFIVKDSGFLIAEGTKGDFDSRFQKNEQIFGTSKAQKLDSSSKNFDVYNKSARVNIDILADDNNFENGENAKNCSNKILKDKSKNTNNSSISLSREEFNGKIVDSQDSFTSKLESQNLKNEQKNYENRQNSSNDHNETLGNLRLNTTFENILGEVFNCYIIVQKGENELIFIDKHAAHERIIYNNLKKSGKKLDSQILLKPMTVTLSKKEYTTVLGNLSLFSDSGYCVEDFGEGCVIVRSAPVWLRLGDIENSIIEIANYVMKNKINLETSYMDWLYHNIACRSAIKAGTKSSSEEIKDLLKTLNENPDVTHCPHGRPIYISLSKKHVEKQFCR